MKFLGIIPSRYASTRFPGKPLIDIHGKPMVQWVWENASRSLDEVWIATDDERIYHAAKAFGGKVVMTSAAHPSGTDRCAEALAKIEAETQTRYDVVINIQGDEPFVAVSHIETLKKCFGSDTQLATLAKKIESTAELTDPSVVKLVRNTHDEAIYFSRAAIPYYRGLTPEEWLTRHEYFRHLGMYAYRREVLQALTKLSPSALEMAESLEQLRWLENGYKITCGYTDIESGSIDTPEDLANLLSTIHRFFE
jgi:3-deoxy-manno-octulosonate cytidylyltransferase (CMP-KDO synthetase)